MVIQLEYWSAQSQTLKQDMNGHNGKHGEHEGMDTQHPQPIKKKKRGMYATMYAYTQASTQGNG